MGDVAQATLADQETGELYYIALVSSPFEGGKAPAADESSISAKAKELGATVGTWFDISMYKRNHDNDEVNIQIHEVSPAVQLVVTIPESLRKDGRTFYLLGCHDGQTSVVAQGTGDTLEGECGSFCTFAIAYKDAGSGSAAKAATTATGAKASTTAKTGDDVNAGAFIALVAISAGAMAMSLARRRRNE